MAQVPTHVALMNPTVKALKELGGSASTDELAACVIRNMGLPAEVTNQPHGDGGQTEIEYRLAWTRTYLKKYGLLENSARGVWALTVAGKEIGEIDPKDVAKHVRAQAKPRAPGAGTAGPVDVTEEEQQAFWQDRMLEILHAMKFDAFERLCKRVLRESGFVEVEVTGRSGDGGIDGHGILRFAGLISFRVLFQAKRYSSNVSSGVVRDFRGAMMGRADKGLIITTAGFTQDAKAEAVRDGAPPIDLISGNQLVDKLKELGLGVKVSTRMVEDVEVVPEWFAEI